MIGIRYQIHADLLLNSFVLTFAIKTVNGILHGGQLSIFSSIKILLKLNVLMSLINKIIQNLISKKENAQQTQ